MVTTYQRMARLVALGPMERSYMSAMWHHVSEMNYNTTRGQYIEPKFDTVLHDPTVEVATPIRGNNWQRGIFT